jgi:hypothetical protein
MEPPAQQRSPGILDVPRRVSVLTLTPNTPDRNALTSYVRHRADQMTTQRLINLNNEMVKLVLSDLSRPDPDKPTKPKRA